MGGSKGITVSQLPLLPRQNVADKHRLSLPASDVGRHQAGMSMFNEQYVQRKIKSLFLIIFLLTLFSQNIILCLLKLIKMCIDILYLFFFQIFLFDNILIVVYKSIWSACDGLTI